MLSAKPLLYDHGMERDKIYVLKMKFEQKCNKAGRI